MALSKFLEEAVIPSESELELEMGTNDRIGTHPLAILDAAKKRGFSTMIGQNASFEDISTMMADGWAVMLMISVDVPHVVVVQEINATHIFFKDPYFGDRLARDKKKFISEKQTYPNYRWKVLDSETKKYLPDYDFTSIESVRGWIAIKK
jgi:hypothetical protein